MIQSLSWCFHCDPNDALEAAHRVLNLRVFCISSLSHRILFCGCTQDILGFVKPDHDAPFHRGTCERFMCLGSDRHQRLFFSYLLSGCFWPHLLYSGIVWNPLFEASHPCFDLDSSRAAYRAKHIYLSTLARGVRKLSFNCLFGGRNIFNLTFCRLPK